MKVLRLLLSSLALTLVLTVLAVAQTNKNSVPIKVAVIDSHSFYDKETGIKRLVLAERMMGSIDTAASMRYPSQLSEAANLEKEISSLKCQNQNVDDKLVKLKKLKDEIKQTEDEIAAGRKKEEAIIYIPVINQIREKLKEFAKQKGYQMIVDSHSIIESFVSIESDVDDITSEFIKFCNDAFDKEKTN
jgi:cytochrome c-type biogenesis protein CcmH/NrfF